MEVNGLVFLSDAHLRFDAPVARLDDIIKTEFEKLDFVFQYAASHGAAVVHAGDLFDSPRSWLLLPLMIDFLRHRHQVPFFSIYGQHDSYMYSEKKDATTLGILAKTGLVVILSKTPVIIRGQVHLYGASHDEEIPDVPAATGVV